MTKQRQLNFYLIRTQTLQASRSSQQRYLYLVHP